MAYRSYAQLGVGEQLVDRPTACATPAAVAEAPAVVPSVPSPDVPLADQPIFRALLGPAGTGKSTLIRRWVQDGEPGQVCLTTTTGVSAINLGDATTIHSLLGFFDLASLEERFLSNRLTARLRQLHQAGLEHLVTDEISMFSAEHLTFLVRAIEEVNAGITVVRGDLPPLHWTVVGDFAQLGVVGERVPGKRKKAPARFAFESPEWAKFEAGGIEVLRKVWRQTDRPFLDALMAMRKGDASLMEDLCALDWQSKTDMGWEGTTLFAVNEQVDRYNALRHDQIGAEALEFPTQRWGQPRGEWKQIDDVVAIKPGALVMILANKYDQGRVLVYANGDLGYLLEADDKGAWVELQRGERVQVQWVTRQHERPLDQPKYVCKGCGEEAPDGRVRKCPLCGAYLKKVTSEVIGTVTYMPLKLAYGSTTHKSQGLTLDRMQINLRDPFWRTAGMTYVGLSRCRSYQGLRLVGEPGLLTKLTRMDARVARFA